MTYICYLWRYNDIHTACLSYGGESLKSFKERVEKIYPYTEGYHHQYSEFKEIYD